jgi:hypothetical protein
MPLRSTILRRSSPPLALGLLLAVLATGAAPASAQITDPLGAVDAWADAQSLRRLLPESETAGRENRKPPKRRAATPRPTKRQLTSLRFSRDPRVTQANHEAVIAALGPEYDPATVVADIERNRDLSHQAMASFKGRWRPNDLADVASFVLLSGYSAYHGATRLSDSGCLAVRRAARFGLASSRKVRRTPKADKQTAAEMSEIRMIYAISRLNVAIAADDAAGVRSARQGIRTWLGEVYGFDVRSARLTRRGFAKR